MSNVKEKFDTQYKDLIEKCTWWVSTLKLLAQDKDFLVMTFIKRMQETMDASEVSMQDIMTIAQDQIVDIDKKINTLVIETRKFERALDYEFKPREVHLTEFEHLVACLQINQDISEELLMDSMTELEALEVDAKIERDQETANRIKKILVALDEYVFVAVDLGAALEEIYEIELDENEHRFDID